MSSVVTVLIPRQRTEDRSDNAKAYRLWIEILIMGTAVACVLAIVLATLGAAAGAMSSSAPEAMGASAAQSTTETTAADQAFHGMVTCTQCGVRHSAASGQSAADCVRTCVAGGAKFALVDGESTYLLDGDLILLKRAAGRRVDIIGAMRGKTIKVSSLTAAI